MKKYLSLISIIGLTVVAVVVCDAFVLWRLPENLTANLALRQGIPLINVVNSEKSKVNIAKLILGFDLSDPISIMSNQVLAFQSVENLENLGVTQEKEEDANAQLPPETPAVKTPEKKEEQLPIKELNIPSSQGISINNNTTYQFNKEQLLNEALNFKLSKTEPSVLIVHSHSCEAYTPSDKNYYVPSDPSRTEDTKFNVVAVGEKFATTLANMGVLTIHDKTLHDFPSYGGSYKNSLKTVKWYLEKYPSIKIVVDVHRDAMTKADGTKIKVCKDINGEKNAQVMIVTGTNQGGLDHPKWAENLKFSIKWQQKLNELYPGLARPINLTKERYNTHTTTASVILEVGSNGNTLEEALLGSEKAAKALGDLIGNIGH